MSDKKTGILFEFTPFGYIPSDTDWKMTVGFVTTKSMKINYFVAGIDVLFSKQFQEQTFELEVVKNPNTGEVIDEVNEAMVVRKLNYIE